MSNVIHSISFVWMCFCVCVSFTSILEENNWLVVCCPMFKVFVFFFGVVVVPDHVPNNMAQVHLFWLVMFALVGLLFQFMFTLKLLFFLDFSKKSHILHIEIYWPNNNKQKWYHIFNESKEEKWKRAEKKSLHQRFA